ncbi:general secretion pathway protein GspB [Duganella sp. S19_KUP01_CR8]|uniref:general secretion pathway protein GspB n=1 Tax=Duganella sp. S19_KUP01_CR8 TaxID=3025502 RepID=UPI002FCD99A7
MSYILEALKKAQAERQLGSAPTLHAPTLHGADGKAAGGALRKPVVLALLAMGVVIAVLLVLVLRPAQQAAPSSAQQAVASAPALVVPAGVVGAAPAAVPVAAPAVAPSADSQPLAAALPPPVATVTPAPRPHPEPVAAALVPEKSTKPAVAQEEPVQNLRDLPEPIQRSIPHITVGGYIYSKNPADRLLLIDKILRHEGEEVAPGLILDKLQPREAVFNFKGYRYRVPY